MSWQENNIKSIRKPQGYDGKRFIILHAESRKGFVRYADLLFTSKSNALDYHIEMNSEIFTKWVNERLIHSLEEPPLIMMDNTPYRTTLDG